MLMIVLITRSPMVNAKSHHELVSSAAQSDLQSASRTKLNCPEGSFHERCSSRPPSNGACYPLHRRPLLHPSAPPGVVAPVGSTAWLRGLVVSISPYGRVELSPPTGRHTVTRHETHGFLKHTPVTCAVTSNTPTHHGYQHAPLRQYPAADEPSLYATLDLVLPCQHSRR